jgi:predicted transcriptional regulator
MLNRLCRKGVLKRRRLTPSKHKIAKRIPYLYFPAVTADEVRKSVVREIARDYFDDSLSLVAQTTIELLEGGISAETAGQQLSDRRGASRVGIAA